MSYQSDYIQKLQSELVRFYGMRCNNPLCQVHWNIEKLEFAHISETKLSGVGRGKKNRLLDIKKNPVSYTLLCPSCHSAMDGRIPK